MNKLSLIGTRIIRKGTSYCTIVIAARDDSFGNREYLIGSELGVKWISEAEFNSNYEVSTDD